MNKAINELELREIFEKIKNGDENSFESLYKNYHDLVFRISFSILKKKENSEDVCQEVFAKLMKLDKSKFPSTGEASWLYSVTKNEALQFIRKQKENVDIDELYTLESESDEIEDIVDMDSYYKLLEGLKTIDKEIISLKILSDFTFEKIAQMLNMPIGTVQWRYYKSIHSIKLSISNLAAVLVVFTLWKSFEQQNISDVSRNEESVVINEESSDFSFDSKSNYIGVESNENTAVIMERGMIKDYIFIGICFILITFSIIFAIKKKIKIKKSKKFKKFQQN